MRMMRPPLVLAHRWAGLTIAVFIVIAGVTGATMPFYRELTWLCAPHLWATAPPRPGAHPLSGIEIAERLAAQGVVPAEIPLQIDPRHAAPIFVAAPTGRPLLGYDEVAVDPYTGAVKARLRFGAVRAFPRDLPSFLYGLHYGFVAGAWGQLAFGVAALVWTLDCFVGFALTLPLTLRHRRAKSAQAREGWWVRWRRAWRVRPHARGHRLTFDLHQAGGLWFWPVLFVFAWSAVAMTLPQVHDPVSHLLGAKGAWSPPPIARARATGRLSYAAAAARGEKLMQAAAYTQRLGAISPQRLDYLPAAAVWRFSARTRLDVVDDGGQTSVWFSDDDGRKLHFEQPLGATPADGFDAWIVALHEAQVLGLPYRIAVSVFGLLVTGLTVTGVMIWLRKRLARTRKSRKSATVPTA